MKIQKANNYKQRVENSKLGTTQNERKSMEGKKNNKKDMRQKDEKLQNNMH